MVTNHHSYQGIIDPQGDVISPYIFLLCVEILALKIKFNKNITGVIFAKKEAGFKFFADDLSVTVLRTEENLRNFSKILNLSIQYRA